MKPFEEGDLHFDFGPRWYVVKWDDEKAYRKGIHKLKFSPHEGAPPQCKVGEGTRAVDFLAVHEEFGVYFLEIKDGRKQQDIFRKRIESGALFAEVGFKVRDSLAGLIGILNAGSDEKWERFRKPLAAGKVAVGLWVEQALPQSVQEDEAAVLRDVLLTRIGWLTRRAFVTSTRLQGKWPIPELIVTNLPGAGPVVRS